MSQSQETLHAVQHWLPSNEEEKKRVELTSGYDFLEATVYNLFEVEGIIRDQAYRRANEPRW